MHDDLLEKQDVMQVHIDTQIKDLYDADKVIHNIHKPQFYNPGNLDWAYIPQNILSGDIICSASGPSGNHVILVGDNTGHGLPAAIGSMITCETFYSMVSKGFGIAQIIHEVNKKLRILLPIDRFLAAIFIEIDENYESVKIWNAGMPDVIINNLKGELKKHIPSQHMALGIMPIEESKIDLVTVEMQLGDFIYAYSDGVTETFNSAGEIYGEDKFLQAIHAAMDKDKRVDSVISDINQFRWNEEQNDDILLLEVAFDKPVIQKKKQSELNYTQVKPMPWELSLNMQSELLSNVNPVPIIMQTIGELQGFGQHREKLFLIMTEMYSNGLEHGILKLDSSMKQETDGFMAYYSERESRLKKLDDANLSISIANHVEGDKGAISISVQDSGDGFDFESYEITLAENKNSSGRGIALIKDLCRKVEYFDGGRMINVEYEWGNPDEE